MEKAKKACKNSSIDVENHFRDVTKMEEIGSNTQREVEDIELSRYACYLIVGTSNKDSIRLMRIE